MRIIVWQRKHRADMYPTALQAAINFLMQCKPYQPAVMGMATGSERSYQP